MRTVKHIARVRHEDGFTYELDGRKIRDKDTLARIEKLVIPPAWNDVRIATSPGAKILARGVDAAGRSQAIYHEKFRARQEKLKFDRILRFALALPKLRRQVVSDMKRKRYDRPRVLALAVHLIDEDYFRVGNETYAKANGHFGLTTLRSRHVDVEGDTVTFDFIGKSGKEQVKSISDAEVAKMIKKLDEMPGYEIFRYQDASGVMHDISSSDVNAYIKKYMGEEFTAKDFRTWGGTLLAATELIAAEKSSDPKEQKKIITQTVKNVAHKLGNTPAVAKSSYIDPRIFKMCEGKNQMNKLAGTVETMRPKKYMTVDEQRVLRLLESI